MPYTKEELSDVGFYNVFINKLRSTYISKLVMSAKNKFRDAAGVLYSYEDIDTGRGIEDAVILNNNTYSTLATELNRANLEAEDFGAQQGDIGGAGTSLPPEDSPLYAEALTQIQASGVSGQAIYGDDYVTPSEGFVPWVTEHSKSVQNKEYPYYDETNLNKIIDRNITELVTFRFATELPDGVRNGDIVTSEDAEDISKWLIENFQKRKFPNLYSFFGEGYLIQDLKTLTIEQLKEIPDGEDIV
tara:strand:+ start:1024 stop:1758 length:735 start_codon:yes stop_codon:yes gene_type:complete